MSDGLRKFAGRYAGYQGVPVVGNSVREGGRNTMKQYKICQNGMFYVYVDGVKTGTYFYSPGCEIIWEEAGYRSV